MTSALTIISTTPIPKCSFHIVCSPTLARPSHALSSSKLQFTTKSTLPSTPSSTASARVLSSTARSPSLRQLPKITSRTSSKKHGAELLIALLLLLDFFLKAASARTCSAWSFSGRNCPTDRAQRSRPPSLIGRPLDVASGRCGRSGAKERGQTLASRSCKNEPHRAERRASKPSCPGCAETTPLLVCRTYVQLRTSVPGLRTTTRDTDTQWFGAAARRPGRPHSTTVLHRPIRSSVLTDKMMLGSPPAPKCRKEGTPPWGEESASTERRCAPLSSSNSPSP